VILTDGVITVRHPTVDDASSVADAVQSSMPDLRVFMAWATPDYDVAAARQWICGEFTPGEESFVILDSPGDHGRIIGACGLGPIDALNRVIELGYWIRSDRAGCGVATRAAALLARHAIENRAAMRVEIHMSVENVASRRVAEKIGATHEGTMRARLLLSGEYHDAHLYSLIASEPRL